MCAKIDITLTGDDFQNIINGMDTSGIELTPSQKKIEGAFEKYGIPYKDTLYCLVDNTVFGSAKDGFAITNSGIYWHNTFGMDSPSNGIKWDELKKFDISLSGKSIKVGKFSFDMHAADCKPLTLVRLLDAISEYLFENNDVKDDEEYDNTNNNEILKNTRIQNTPQLSDEEKEFINYIGDNKFFINLRNELKNSINNIYQMKLTEGFFKGLDILFGEPEPQQNKKFEINSDNYKELAETAIRFIDLCLNCKKEFMKKFPNEKNILILRAVDNEVITFLGLCQLYGNIFKLVKSDKLNIPRAHAMQIIEYFKAVFENMIFYKYAEKVANEERRNIKIIINAFSGVLKDAVSDDDGKYVMLYLIGLQNNIHDILHKNINFPLEKYDIASYDDTTLGDFFIEYYVNIHAGFAEYLSESMGM